MNTHQQLIEILKTQALDRLPKPIKLASGAWSSEFIDAKKGLAAWRDLRVASEVMSKTITQAGHRFDAVGGLTLGADALAVGIAAVSDCRWFVIRKEAKKRGTKRLVEGARIGPGDNVLIVDDIVTTGGSILKACKEAMATGARVVAAATLVDRGEIAAPKFKALKIDYLPITTYESLDIEPVQEPMETA